MTNLNDFVFTPALAKHVFKMKKSAIDLLHNISFWDKKVTLQQLSDDYSGTIFDKINRTISKLEVVQDIENPTLKLKTSSGKDNAAVKVTSIVVLRDTIKVISHTATNGRVDLSESVWCNYTGVVLSSSEKNKLSGISTHVRTSAFGDKTVSRISGTGQLFWTSLIKEDEEISLNGLRTVLRKTTETSFKDKPTETKVEVTYLTRMPNGDLIKDTDAGLIVTNRNGIIKSKVSKELSIVNELFEFNGKQYIDRSETTDSKGVVRTIQYTYYFAECGDVTMVDVSDDSEVLRLYADKSPKSNLDK